MLEKTAKVKAVKYLTTYELEQGGRVYEVYYDYAENDVDPECPMVFRVYDAQDELQAWAEFNKYCKENLTNVISDRV